MEITDRKWKSNDLIHIQAAWLDYCRAASRSDMLLKKDAEAKMKEWLVQRSRDPQTLGLVAEADGAFAGFLIARIDEWDSVPPVIEPRRIGIIDALYVLEAFRRHGIATQLINNATERMRAAHVVAIETIYDAWNPASDLTWRRAGFAPWMVHAYRML